MSDSRALIHRSGTHHDELVRKARLTQGRQRIGTHGEYGMPYDDDTLLFYADSAEDVAEVLRAALEAEPTAEARWTIRVCVECDLPVESCSCDPKDWVGEPPHRTVRVEEVR